MSVTAWLALFVVCLTLAALIKRIETRLTLLCSGFILCILSCHPMAALDQFAKSMTSSGLILSICSAMGFAFLVSYTKADVHLVTLLTKPVKSLGIFLIPACTLMTACINAAIPSAAGCAAAVGTTLLPLMIRSGISPAGAAAAVLAGTYGNVFNPGGPHQAMIAGLAKTDPMGFVLEHAVSYAILILISTALLTLIVWLLKDHQCSVQPESFDFEDNSEPIKVNLLFAAAPIVPLVILVLGNTCLPAIKMGVAQAMLIGAFYTILVTRADPQEACKRFFNGAGSGYGNVLGIIIAAGVFAAGLREAGLISALIDGLKNSGDFARFGGGLGTYAMAVLTGSGDAAAFAFNEAVTPHAAELGMSASNLGNTALMGAQLGRTSSPVAGVVILLAGLVRVSPIDLIKRTALPMAAASISLLLFF